MAADYSAAMRIQSVNARDIGLDIFVSAFNNPAGCSHADVVRVAPSMANARTMTATALTAFSIGR